MKRGSPQKSTLCWILLFLGIASGILSANVSNASEWSISTIDSVGLVGRNTSIAIDSNNKVHISYYDRYNGDLKYATNAPPANEILYDDFSGALINKNKWKQGESVREADVANHRLVSKLGTPNLTTIETYPYKSTNDLVFFNPQSINSIQADVSVLDKNVANNGAVKATTGGRWYHCYVSGQGGYVWAEIAIKGDSSGLKATWSVLKSSDPYYSVWETLGSGDFTTIIDLGTTYALYVGYDVGGNQFTFKVGAEEQTFGPTGLPDRDAIGIDAWKSLSTQVEAADSTSSGYISATFTNIYVNNSLYEDFSSVFLDPTKWWIPYSIIDGEFHNFDELVREVSEGTFRSKIRSQSPVTEVYSRLEFANPSSIRFIRTKVTPLQYQNEDNQGARVEACIAGHFYNEETSNIGYAGEVEAKIWIGGNWNGGGATPAARWWVAKFLNSTGTFRQILDQGTFTIPITLGTTYVLSIRMNANQLTFTIEHSVTGAAEEAIYVPVTSINPPSIPWKGIGTFVYNATDLEATIEALFDDVMVDPRPGVVDFDGDRKTDISFYRSSTAFGGLLPPLVLRPTGSDGVALDLSLFVETMMAMVKPTSPSTIPPVVAGGLSPLQEQDHKDRWGLTEWVGVELDSPLSQEITMAMGRPMWPFTRVALADGGLFTLPTEVTMEWAGAETLQIFH